MNLPNKITILRICLIPIMMIVFYIDFVYSGLIAALIFTLAAFTDFLDGYIARKYNMVTNAGKFLDPIADKVLVVVALCMVLEASIVPLVYGSVAVAIVVSRELIISGFRQIAAANGVVIAADKTGKIKAVFQDIATGTLLALPTFKVILTDNIYYASQIFAFSVLAVSVVLTVVSGVLYVTNNKQVLKGN